MTYRVIVTIPAVADSEAIREHIARTSTQAADRILLLLEKACDSLADFPNRYPIALESKTHTADVRHLLVANYRILYTIYEDKVFVLRIRHAAQRPFKPGELN